MAPLNDQARERIQQTLDLAFDHPEKVSELCSSLELHMFGVNWNWDNASKEPLFRLIRDQRCDLGTALRIYWAGDPVSLYEKAANRDEVEAYYQERYDLLREIQQRVSSGFYTQREISFNVEENWIPGLTASDDLKQPLPALMLEPPPGIQPEGEEDFYN